MKYTKYLFQYLWRCCFVTICVYTFSACNFDPNEPIGWKTDLLLPIAHSTVGVGDILSDSASYEVESDQFVSTQISKCRRGEGMADPF